MILILEAFRHCVGEYVHVRFSPGTPESIYCKQNECQEAYQAKCPFMLMWNLCNNIYFTIHLQSWRESVAQATWVLAAMIALIRKCIISSLLRVYPGLHPKNYLVSMLLFLWTIPETASASDISITPNVYTDIGVYDDTSLKYSFYTVRGTCSGRSNSELISIISVQCMTQIQSGMCMWSVHGKFVLVTRKGWLQLCLFKWYIKWFSL